MTREYSIKILDFYAANFRKVTKDEGLQTWVDWLENPLTEYEQTMKAVIRLAEVWETRFSPKLKDLRKSYAHITIENLPLTPVQLELPDCEVCGNKGHRYIIVFEKEKKCPCFSCRHGVRWEIDTYRDLPIQKRSKWNDYCRQHTCEMYDEPRTGNERKSDQNLTPIG